MSAKYIEKLAKKSKTLNLQNAAIFCHLRRWKGGIVLELTCLWWIFCVPSGKIQGWHFIPEWRRRRLHQCLLHHGKSESYWEDRLQAYVARTKTGWFAWISDWQIPRVDTSQIWWLQVRSPQQQWNHSIPRCFHVCWDWKTLGQCNWVDAGTKLTIQNWCSVQFSCSVVSDSLRPHELQHARPPCPSPTPRVHSNSCPSSRWCHPTISSPVVPLPTCLQSFPASGSFQISQFFASGGQRIGVSASTWWVDTKPLTYLSGSISFTKANFLQNQDTPALASPVSLTSLQVCSTVLTLQTGLIWRLRFLKIQHFLSAFSSTMRGVSALAVFWPSFPFQASPSQSLPSDERVLTPMPKSLFYLTRKENTKAYLYRKQGDIWHLKGLPWWLRW